MRNLQKGFTDTDIQSNIKNIYLNYYKHYAILNEENALNLVVAQYDVIF